MSLHQECLGNTDALVLMEDDASICESTVESIGCQNMSEASDAVYLKREVMEDTSLKTCLRSRLKGIIGLIDCSFIRSMERIRGWKIDWFYLGRDATLSCKLHMMI